MELSHAIPIGIGLAAAIAFAVVTRNTFEERLKTYWDRACSGRAWKRAFPSAGKEEIRRFLYLFVDAFAFPRTRALKFLPTDRLLSIYRMLYPSRETPDALELETLSRSLKRSFGFDLEAIWREDLTLGEAFSRTRSPVA